MEHEARYARIGAFSTAVVLAAAAFFYWFAISGTAVATRPYDVIFTGTVTGLTAGTDVLFNGIKVGQVNGVALDQNDPSKVIARIEVSTAAPVKADTKALLEFQGLTGVRFVQLSGGTAAAGDLQPAPGDDVATIIADKSEFQSILEGVTDTLSGASIAFDRLNTFLDVNEDKVAATLDNAQQFSRALAANADGLEATLASLADAGQEIGPLAAELKNLSASLQGVMSAIPPEKITETVDNLTAFSEAVARNSGKVDTVFNDATALTANLTRLSEQLNGPVETIAETTAAIDPETVAELMSNLAALSDVVGNNSGNVDTAIRNITEMSTSLQGSAAKVEEILGRVDGMVAGGDADGLFAELSETARSVRVLADELNTRSAEVTRGLSTFTTQGLSEFQNFAVEARATLARLDRVIRNIENNPQGLIFGNGGEGTVREYNKR